MVLHKSLLAAEEVFSAFRSGFKGKASDVHFFWGSFDQAVSLFSGNKAPEHPGGIPNLADWVVKEAYAHEVMSVGFWPGSQGFPEAAFCCYLYPEPQGYSNEQIEPKEAFYHESLREFILPYKVVQQSDNPDVMLRKFLGSCYKADAGLANWDTQALGN